MAVVMQGRSKKWTRTERVIVPDVYPLMRKWISVESLSDNSKNERWQRAKTEETEVNTAESLPFTLRQMNLLTFVSPLMLFHPGGAENEPIFTLTNQETCLVIDPAGGSVQQHHPWMFGTTEFCLQDSKFGLIKPMMPEAEEQSEISSWLQH